MLATQEAANIAVTSVAARFEAQAGRAGKRRQKAAGLRDQSAKAVGTSRIKHCWNAARNCRRRARVMSTRSVAQHVQSVLAGAHFTWEPQWITAVQQLFASTPDRQAARMSY